MPTFLRKLFEQYAKRLLTNKVRPSILEEGIMTIPNNKRVTLMAENLYKDFKKAGVPDNVLRTENDIKVFHHKIAEMNNENIAREFDHLLTPKKPAEVFDLKGNKIKNPDNIMGGEEIIETEAEILAKLNKGNKESLSNMRYEAASKAEEAKAAADEDYIIKLFDPEDFAEGGRAGLYRGGQAEIEPSLSDIGHGSDALMARNALLTPGSQATTSTGLNYLLGEDNDTTRVPYKHGDMVLPARQNFGIGGMSRRAFLKLIGSGAAGIGAAKSGLFSLLKGGAGKKAVTEVATSAGSGQPPAYFFNLVKKIKNLGDDVTETASTAPHQRVHKYQDYELTENVSTGYVEINKKGQDIAEDVYMSFKKGETLPGKKKGVKVADEYEEFTARPDQDGKMKDVEMGVPDEVVQEGTIFEDTLSEFGKADGGRIGYGKGKIVTEGIPALIRALLKDKKKVKQAVDDIYPTGDYKYDAEMAADALVENNPKEFKGLLREDLDDMTRSEVYGAVLGPIQNNALMVSRMKKATKPTKTLEGIEKTGTIDISNPGIADEFTRFMKETNPKDYKNLEEKVILESFDPKGKKGHATGGRVSLSVGGLAGMLGE